MIPKTKHAGGLGDGSPQRSAGAAHGGGLGLALPHDLNSTGNLNANWKWKCNKVAVKSIVFF